MRAIIFSKKDLASMNALSCLGFSHKERVWHNCIVWIIEGSSVNAEHIDEEISQEIGEELQALIFVTKHASKSGKPSFSVHTQGNWSSADMGGKPFTLAVTPVVLKHHLYKSLLKTSVGMNGFEVVQECTHHGPNVKTPSLFIEIGSTENEWVRKDAGQVICKTLIEVLTKSIEEKSQSLVLFGIGGNHTCANFMKYISNDTAMLGHVCPGYRASEVTKESILEGINKSTLEPMIVIDWKGLKSEQRQHILAILDENKLPYLKLSDLKSAL